MSGLHDDMSSDDDFDHVLMPGTGPLFSRERDELHRAMAKLKEVPFGEDDFRSPIGSPAADSFSMGDHGRFQELKRKLEEDQANRLKSKNGPLTNSREINGALGSMDADVFLDVLNPEIENNDQSRLSSLTMRLDNHPKFTEMYRQIKERDHKILDLEARMNELDRQAVDMRDSINERDTLINSKNEAITMFQNKHRKELEQKEDELRKTQQTMFDLEKNLSGIQDRFNEEKNRLTSELESQRNQSEVLQANMEALEAKADALQSKSEVLAAELSFLNNQKEELQKSIVEKDETLVSKDMKIEELLDSSTKLETTTKKLKMQFQAKLKTMKAGLAEKEEQFQKLHAEKADFLLEKEDLLRTIAEKEEILSSKAKETVRLSQLEQELADSLERLREVEEKSVSAVETRDSEMETLKMNFRVELESMEREKMVLHDELVQTKAEKETLQIDLAERVEQVQKSKDLENALEQGLGQKHEELLQAFEAKLRERDDALECLKWEHQESLENCQQLSNEIKKLNNAETEFQLQKEEMMRSIAEKEEVLSSKDSEIDSIKAEFAIELESVSASAATLNDEIARIRGEKESLQKDFEERVEQLQKLKDNEDILIRELSQKQEEVEAFQVMLREREDVQNSLNLENKETLENFNQLSNEVQKLNTQKAEFLLEKEELIRSIAEKEKVLSSKDTEMDLMKHEFTMELESITARAATLNDEIARIRGEKEVLEKKLEEPRNDSDKIELIEDIWKEELSQAVQEKELISTKLMQCQDELESLKWEHEENLETCKQLSNEIQKLNVEKAELLLVKEELQRSIAEKEEVLSSKGNETLRCSELEQEVADFRERMHEMEEKSVAALESRDLEMETLEMDFRVELESVKQDRTILHDKLVQIKADKEILQKDLTEREEQVEKLKDSEVTLQAGLNQKLEEIEALKASLKQREDVLEPLKWEYEETLENCKQLSNEVQKLNTGKTEFVLEKEELLRSIADKEEVLSYKETEIDVIKAELECITASAATLNDEIARIRGEKEVLEKKLEEPRNDSDKIELIEDIWREELSQAVQEKELISTKLKECEDELESLKWEHEENLETCKQLSNEIQKLNVEKAELLLGKEQLQHSIAEKENILSSDAKESESIKVFELEQEVADLLQKLTELEGNYQNSIAALQSRESEIEELKNKFVKELDDLKANNATLSDQIIRVSEEKDTLERRLEEPAFESTKVTLNEGTWSEEMNASLKEKEVLLAKLEEREDELESLKWEHEENLDTCKQLNKEIQKLNAVKDDLQADKVELLERIFEKDTILQAKDVQIEELTESSTKLDTTIKKLKIQYQTKLKAMKMERNDKEEVVNGDEEVVKLRNRISELLNQISDLTEETNMLSLQKSDQDNSQVLNKDLTNEIDRLKAANEDAFKQIQNFKDSLEHAETEVVQAVDEIRELKKTKDNLQQQLAQTIGEKETLQQQVLEQSNPGKNEPLLHSENDSEELLKVKQENLVLERKVELLQGMISDIDLSAMKSCEENILLKSWARELETDNQRKQSEIDLYKSLGNGDSRNIKATILQEEVTRLVNQLQDRDRRCEDLVKDIILLREENDNLNKQQLSHVAQKSIPGGMYNTLWVDTPEHRPSYEELRQRVEELQEAKFSNEMDLKRARECRRLVEEQLFFSQSSRSYGSSPRSKSPVPVTPNRSPPRSSNPSNIGSPSLLAPISAPTVPPLGMTIPTPLGSPAIAMLPVDPPVVSTDQFQTVELDGNSASSRTQSPPSPVMRI